MNGLKRVFNYVGILVLLTLGVGAVVTCNYRDVFEFFDVEGSLK